MNQNSQPPKKVAFLASGTRGPGRRTDERQALRVPFFAVTVSDAMNARRLGSEVPKGFVRMVSEG